MKTSGNRLYYVHNDHLGMPRILTDQDQNKVWEIQTTPCGEVSEVITTGITNIKGFPGQYRDEETGYVDNWHRTYDASIGRYVQSDPIGLAGGLNTYAYVGGNPLSYTDPKGLAPNPMELTCVVDPAQPVCWAGVATDVATSLLGGGAVAVLMSTPSDSDSSYTDAGEQCSDEPSEEECSPPAGTVCSEFHSGGVPHKLTDFEGNKLDPQDTHVHTWQMNKSPNGCIWNKRRQQKFTFNYTPITARACSSYPSWVAQQVK